MRILVPVDDSIHSLKVIDFLSHRESLLGSSPQIELVNVQYSVPESLIHLLGIESVKAYCLAEGKKVFDAINAQGAEKLNAVEKVLYGEPGKTIAHEAEESKADLIVMGTRGLNPVKSLFLGSVSNAVLANTTTPMLLLRDESSTLPDKLRVGIFVDGSEYGAAAATFVLQNLPLFGKESEFTVVHAAEELPAPIAPNPIGPMVPRLTREEIDQTQRQDFEEAVRPVLEPFKEAGVKIEAKLLFGEPDDVLADYANDNLDLIVMGSHGYGNFTAAVMGSTAMHVGARTKKPILIVRK